MKDNSIGDQLDDLLFCYRGEPAVFRLFCELGLSVSEPETFAEFCQNFYLRLFSCVSVANLSCGRCEVF